MSIDKNQTDSLKWYIISTYVGHEDKVAATLNQKKETLEIADKIADVISPKEKQAEIKNGKKRIVEKRIFPGYVFVKMLMNEETWFFVRNTPGVSGFAGAAKGTSPTAVPDSEMKKILKRMDADVATATIDFKAGDIVSIIDGPFKGFEGSVSEVDAQKAKLKVLVSMFGRETSVEIDALQVKKLS
jgi:transcriptional antiterminator NusG